MGKLTGHISHAKRMFGKWDPERAFITLLSLSVWLEGKGQEKEGKI